MVDSHRCREGAMDCDCPICGEYMFTSPKEVQTMKCGHMIHKGCRLEHIKTSYKCPICSKSIENMESQFRRLDKHLEEQPMPPEYRGTRAIILCNDCEAKTSTRFHWGGLKCEVCLSYNTVEIRLIDAPDEGATTPRSRASGIQPSIEDPISGSSRTGSAGQPLPGHRPSVSQGANALHTATSPVILSDRMARSASPPSVPGLADSSFATEDSDEEDIINFWGRDDHRSMTSGEIIEDHQDSDEDEEDEDSDACLDDADEDEDDEDEEIVLFGHR